MLLRLVAFFLLVLFLPSCTIFPTSSSVSRLTYELVPPSVANLNTSRSLARILVRVPTALTAVDSNRIVFRQPRGRITWLSGVQWSDSVPRMVQARLVELFENTGSFAAVLRPGDGISSSHHLLTDIRRFELSFNNVVHLELSLKLLSRKSGSIVSSRVFTSVALSGSSTESRIDAFDKAFSTMSRDIVVWVLSEA